MSVNSFSTTFKSSKSEGISFVSFWREDFRWITIFGAVLVNALWLFCDDRKWDTESFVSYFVWPAVQQSQFKKFTLSSNGERTFQNTHETWNVCVMHTLFYTVENKQTKPIMCTYYLLYRSDIEWIPIAWNVSFSYPSNIIRFGWIHRQSSILHEHISSFKSIVLQLQFELQACNIYIHLYSQP